MKKVLSILTLILCVVIINNLVTSIYSLWKKQDLFVQARITLGKEKKENEILKKQLSEVKKTEYIETQARNKLFMAKPNESEILIPQEQKAANAKKRIKIQTWQKWVTLFFGG